MAELDRDRQVAPPSTEASHGTMPERLQRRMAPGGMALGGSLVASAPSPAIQFADAVSAGTGGTHSVQQAAAHGLSGASGSLPHLGAIQQSFGRHDVGNVQAHVGGPAAEGAKQMGAQGFAAGNSVAFASSPDVHLAAHEAAHVVQQRAGVQLKGGVGEVGDAYENHADAVADLVVQGKSAESLLDTMAPSSAASAGGVQQSPIQRREVAERNPVAALTVAQGALSQAAPDQLQTLSRTLDSLAHATTATVPLEFRAGGDHYQFTLQRDDVLTLQDEVRAAQRHPTPPAAAPAPTGGTTAPPHAPSLPTTGVAPSLAPLAGHGAGPLASAADSRIRIDEYVNPTRRFSERVLEDVNSGRLSPEEGAVAASFERARLREFTRGMVSPSARAQSMMIEPDSATWGQLCDRYALRALRNDPALRARYGITTLEATDTATMRALQAMRGSEDVMRAVIGGAGRTNPGVTGAARFTRVAAPVMVGTQVAIGGYRVLTADEGEHSYTAGEEVSGFTGGTVGAMVGTAIVSFLGAFVVAAEITTLTALAASTPVTLVLSLAIVGGLAAVGDAEGRSIWDRVVDRRAMHDSEIAMEHAINTFAQASAGDRIASAVPGSLMAGGGFGGLMDRDREHAPVGGQAPTTSGGEAP